MRWPICGQTSPQAMRQLVQDSQPCSSPISVRQASLQKKVSCDPHASHMGSRDESTNPTRVLRLCGHCEGGPTSHLDHLISRMRLSSSPSPGFLFFFFSLWYVRVLLVCFCILGLL